jgi:regulator of RNase E activity RraA
MDIRAYSGAIYDIIKFDLEYPYNFVLPNDIKPLYSDIGFTFGRAFTARGSKNSHPNLRIIDEMIDNLDDKSVYVLQANDNSRAHFGDIMSLFMERAGIRGAVLQGWTRDATKIEYNRFKLWCKGVQPQDSADMWGITNYLEEIVIGNVFITPEDYIFADRDGVLVIKNYLLSDVLNMLPYKLDYEEKIRFEIQCGKSASEIYEKVGKW